jgi:hypothetical protein
LQEEEDRQTLLDAVDILKARLRKEQQLQGDSADISLGDLSATSVLAELRQGTGNGTPFASSGQLQMGRTPMYSDANEIFPLQDGDSSHSAPLHINVDYYTDRAQAADGTNSDTTPTPSPSALAMLYSTVNKVRGGKCHPLPSCHLFFFFPFLNPSRSSSHHTTLPYTDARPR